MQRHCQSEGRIIDPPLVVFWGRRGDTRSVLRDGLAFAELSCLEFGAWKAFSGGTDMHPKTILAVTAFAILLAGMVLPSGVEAKPRGWKCGYTDHPLNVGPVRLRRGPYYYACYGRGLRETRSRARARCRRLPSCNPGACLPLDYAPRAACGRE